MVRRALPLALLSVLVVACSESPTQLPVSPDLEVAFAGRVINSATGSGHIITSAQRTFAFAAVEMADGTVQGEFELVIHTDPEIRLHAEVVCMSTAGNRAWVGGVVRNSSNPAWIGLETAWAVEDNGVGDPSPDIISLMNIPTPGVAQPNCDSQARVPNFPVLEGNVTVR